MKKTITVHKLDAQGQEVIAYSGVLLERTESSIQIEARFERQDIDVHGLSLRRGDRFIETFHANRWYNVFTIFDADDGCLKGWYCNMTRPAILQAAHVYAEDLALDMIVYPDGRWMVLDEEEFAELDLKLEEKRRALEALTELQALVVKREGPFSALRER